MAVRAEVVSLRANPELRTFTYSPKLPKVPRAKRIYHEDGPHRGRQIGTLQEAEDGTLTAHVMADFRNKKGKITRRLVQLTAPADTDRDTLIAIMREVSEPLPAQGPNNKEVKIPRRGLSRVLPGERTVGTIHESQRFALGGEEGNTLMKVATLHGELDDKTLVRRPADRQVVVAAYDGSSHPPGDVAGEAADLQHMMEEIAQEEYRITPTRTASVQEGDTVRGRVRFGRATYRRSDGEKAEEGVMVASVVDDEGRLVPLARTTIRTRVQNGTGRRSDGIGKDVAAALRELRSYYPPRENPVYQVEAVEVERVIPEAVGAIDQGGRSNQEDAFGINGKLQLAEIGEGQNAITRIRSLAEALLGKGATPESVSSKMEEIQGLEEEVTMLIRQNKLRGVAAVADGMGGGLNGEMASSIAVYAFQRALVDRIKTSRVVDIEFFAQEAAEAANKVVFDYSSTVSDDRLTKPQTAFAAYVIGPDNKVTFVKDGDCHAYLDANGVIERVLPDNSLAQLRLEFDQLKIDEEIFPRLTFSEIYTPEDPADNTAGKIRSTVTHMFGGESRVGNYLHIETRDLPDGGRIFLATDGVTESYDRASDANREIVREVEHSVEEMVEAGKKSRAEAINWGFGQIFQRIILAGAPREPQKLAQRLVKNRPNNLDNAAVVITDVPALITA